VYTHLELHLAAVPLSRKHARALKKITDAKKNRMGGSFARYVTLPASERDLIDDLVRSYPCRVNGSGGRKGTAIVARGGNTHGEPAWVSVQYVAPIGEGEAGPSAQFERLHAEARAQAVERGILPSDEQVAWDHMHAVASAENGRRNRQIHLEVMLNALELYLVHTGMDKQLFWEQRACAERYLKQYQEGGVL
jgi:hypothetical protein